MPDKPPPPNPPPPFFSGACAAYLRRGHIEQLNATCVDDETGNCQQCEVPMPGLRAFWRRLWIED